MKKKILYNFTITKICKRLVYKTSKNVDKLFTQKIKKNNININTIRNILLSILLFVHHVNHTQKKICEVPSPSWFTGSREPLLLSLSPSPSYHALLLLLELLVLQCPTLCILVLLLLVSMVLIVHQN